MAAWGPCGVMGQSSSICVWGAEYIYTPCFMAMHLMDRLLANRWHKEKSAQSRDARFTHTDRPGQVVTGGGHVHREGQATF
jgi:hypothetical protein